MAAFTFQQPQATVSTRAIDYLDNPQEATLYGSAKDDNLAWSRKKAKAAIKDNKNAFLRAKLNDKGKSVQRKISSFPETVWGHEGPNDIAIGWINPDTYADAFGLKDKTGLDVYNGAYPVFLYGTPVDVRANLMRLGFFPPGATEDQINNYILSVAIRPGSLVKEGGRAGQLLRTDVQLGVDAAESLRKLVVAKEAGPKAAVQAWTPERLNIVLWMASNLHLLRVLDVNGVDIGGYSDGAEGLTKPVDNIFTNRLEAIERASYSADGSRVAAMKHTVDISDYTNGHITTSNEVRQPSERSLKRPVRYTLLLATLQNGTNVYYNPGFVVSNDSRSLELVLGEMAALRKTKYPQYGFYDAQGNLVDNATVLETFKQELNLVKKHKKEKTEKAKQETAAYKLG